MGKRKQMPGQGQLMNTSPMERLLKDNPKVAFGRIVMPYFFKLKAEDYSDITPRMAEAAKPSRLLPYLLPTMGRFAVDHVALDSGEYERIVRNPGAFGAAVSNRTFRARSLDHNTRRRIDDAQRSYRAALEAKYPQMQITLAGIQQEQAVIKNLQTEAKSPGYAHKPIDDMLGWANTARYQVFDRILEVVGREKDWSDEQADLASRSLDVRLFFSGSERVGNWRQMLGLAEMYGDHRENIFADRIERVGQVLGASAISQHANEVTAAAQ